MGLDMYLTGEKFFVPDYKTLQDEYEAGKERPSFEEARALGKPVDDDGEPVCSTQHELGYWRKFAPLHQYIVETFADGVDECQRIDLDEGSRPVARGFTKAPQRIACTVAQRPLSGELVR
jgi:hypothetical protein